MNPELSSIRLPSSWDCTTLGEAASLRTGGSAPQGEKYFVGGRHPFVRVQHFDGTVEYLRRWDLITDEAVEDYRLKLFPKGTILFPKSGASIHLEKRAKLPFDAYVVSHLCCVQPIDNKVRSDFLFYLLKLFRFGHTANGSTLPYLNLNQLKERKIPLPPLPEQRKIAGVLGVVQRTIEQQKRLIALNTELKEALLHQFFTHGLRGDPQKQTEIGPVPEGWEQRPLEQAGEVVYGIQAAVASNLKPVGTKILTNKNITLDGKIVLEKINYFVLETKRHHETVLKKGDLLFNWRSGSKEHVGKTAYFDLAGEFVHSSFILRIRPRDKVTGRYLFYYLNFLRESGFFLKKQTFSVNAKFNKSAINELPTYLPGEEERREIVGALDAVGKKLEVLQAKRRLLEDLFRTLLHQLMTAQIRVHNLDLPELGNTQ